MRRTLTAALVLAAVALAGCGGGDGDPTATELPTTTTTETPTTTTTEAVDATRTTIPLGLDPHAFGTAVRGGSTSFADYTDVQLTAAGLQICAAFDQGVGFKWELTLGVRTLGATPEDMATLIGGAVHVICPQHISLLEGTP